jgi:short subunit fatty acids transporter
MYFQAFLDGLDLSSFYIKLLFQILVVILHLGVINGDLPDLVFLFLNGFLLLLAFHLQLSILVMEIPELVS